MAQPNEHSTAAPHGADSADPHLTTGTEHAGGHAGAFPPFASDTFLSQLIWLALSFGLLYYLMSKIALPRIEAILNARSQRLSSDLNDAQRMKSEADRAGEAYETNLREAQARAGAIVQDARNKLQAEADTRRKAQEAELNQRLAASEQTIRERTEAAMGNVRGIASETASAIVERLTGQAPDQASLDRALNATAH